MSETKKNNFSIIILGATASGKTNLSLELASKHSEIISVDSRQVYKYMDIGTAKPSRDELLSIPHHLISIIEPNERFTAGLFKKESENLINNIYNRGKIPFLVGGTGLYFNSILYGLSPIPAVPNHIRDFVDEKIKSRGIERIYEVLTKIDPLYAEKIHKNDRQRISRAIEVFSFTKRPIFSFFAERISNNFKFIKIGIEIDRELLYKRIDHRVDIMIKNGLIEETENLLKIGYSRESFGMKTIGYAEIVDYIENRVSRDEAIELIKRNTRHYAKRQITWFKKIDGISWFNYNDSRKMKDFIEKQL
jgi:tRNA dimethylallyltransferase